MAAEEGIKAYSLTDIAQGDTSDRRTGDKAYISAITIKGEIDTALMDLMTIRFKWWVVTQRNTTLGASTLTASTLLENTDIPLLSPLKEDFRRNYIVHRTGYLTLDNDGSGGVRAFSFFKKFFKPIQVRFNGTSGSISEQMHGNTQLLMVWDGAGSAIPVNLPTLKLYTKTYFTD